MTQGKAHPTPAVAVLSDPHCSMQHTCFECGGKVGLIFCGKCLAAALASKPSQPAQQEGKHLSLELLGVITDVEEGSGFDDVCLETVKRVYRALAGGAAK